MDKKITDKMIMIKLKCSYDTGSRHSIANVNKISEDLNCNSNMLSVRVKMFDPDMIGGFTKALSRLRGIYNLNTLPWDERGWRVVSSKAFSSLKNKLETAINDLNESFEKCFIDNYDEHKEYFDNRKGDLDDVEFPLKSEMRDRFKIDYDIGAIASSSDIRIQGIDQEARRELKESMEKQYEDKIKTGLNDIATRLSNATKDICERTADKDQNGKKYKRSLENLQELTTAVEDLNMTGDDRIKEACSLIRENICQYSSEAIKTTDIIRENVNKDAGSISEMLDQIAI
tara:strand:+ start:1004 stop:1864 length:861 start_codon:yes stop_codon:yes gene_type:complete